jgi:hypothetical protein
MPDTDDVVLWYALYRLITNYWFEVDFNGGGNGHDFYVPDGLFVVGDNRFQGAREDSRVLRLAPAAWPDDLATPD